MRNLLKIGMPVRLVIPFASVYKDFLTGEPYLPARGIITQKSGDLFYITWKEMTSPSTLKGWWPKSYLEIDTIEYLKQLNRKGKV